MREDVSTRGGRLTVWHPVSKDPPINESDNRFFLGVFVVVMAIGVVGFIVAVV